MGPDGTRLKQNDQAMLKSLYKHAGQLVYGKEREADLKIRDEGKEDHSHSQQIKLNNFNVSLWDKRKEIVKDTVFDWGFRRFFCKSLLFGIFIIGKHIIVVSSDLAAQNEVWFLYHYIVTLLHSPLPRLNGLNVYQ